MYKEGDIVYFDHRANRIGCIVKGPAIDEKTKIVFYTILDFNDAITSHGISAKSLYTDTHNHPCMAPKPVYIGIGPGGYYVCKECDTKITI